MITNDALLPATRRCYSARPWSTCGRIEVDNNHCENTIRPFVLGRKSWLFADTPAGAEASARLYSVIETAKENGLEPYAYLTRVFAELPAAIAAEDDEAIEKLLPWKVAARDAQRPPPRAVMSIPGNDHRETECLLRLA